MTAEMGQLAFTKSKTYVSPLSVLVVLIFLLTLAISGVRVQDTVAAREPNSSWGQVVAGAAALCIEGTTALISYRIFDLRRRGRPVPRLLLGGLVFFITTSIAANTDHSLRYAQSTLAGQTGETLAWEIALSVFLSIAAPSGLLLFAEMLSEYVQSVDMENAALLEKHQEEVRKTAERERRRAERLARKSVEQGWTEERPRQNERRGEQVERQTVPVEQRWTQVDLDEWKPVLQLADGTPFTVDLVEQAFGVGSSAAYNRLTKAGRIGLVVPAGPRGYYRFGDGLGTRTSPVEPVEE